jgi:hexosaminidase
MNTLLKASVKKILVLFLVTGNFFSTALASRYFNPDSLRLEWKLIKNQRDGKSGFICRITVTNRGGELMPSSRWKIYFNLRYHGFRLRSLTDEMKIKHVSGDLFFIAPDSGFHGLARMESIDIEYTGSGRIANYQDAPSGLFWVNDDDPGTGTRLHGLWIHQPAASDLTNPSGTESQEPDEINSYIKDIPRSELPPVFPTPVEWHMSPGNFLLNAGTRIIIDDIFLPEARYLAGQIQKLTGKRPQIQTSGKIGNLIRLKREALPPEAYRLVVTPALVSISAADGAGVFYGIQSLQSLLPGKAWASIHPSLKIQAVEVFDAPQFPVREFMLDVSRNFQTKKEIMRILDLMALYKLNIFHFHLTDDEGWRIAIPGLPELTGMAAKRGYPFNDGHQLHPSYGSGPDGDHSPGTGYYSVEEFVAILKYASERHIRVIPEIESPGHARAAVLAMNNRYQKFMKTGNYAEAEQYLLSDPLDNSVYMSNQYYNDNVMNVALPSVYTFMEKVIDEIGIMYKKAGIQLTIFHVGGDEVPSGSWEKSPVAIALMDHDSTAKNTKMLWRNYFTRIKELLKKRGISMYGWEELATGTQNSDHSHIVVVNQDFIRDGVQLDAWWNIFGKEDAGYTLANAGYKVVLCPVDYFYFDLAYNKSFKEPGDAWVGYLGLRKVFSFIPYNFYKYTKSDMDGAPLTPGYFDSKDTLTQYGRSHIMGLQAAMWEENIASPGLLEYMLLPRLLAMAERAWTREPAWAAEKDSVLSNKEFQDDWSLFLNVLSKKELPKLKSYNGGYQYRVP